MSQSFRGTGQEVQSISFAYQPHPDAQAQQPVRHPVVVVGAGPVGLTLAIDLGGLGGNTSFYKPTVGRLTLRTDKEYLLERMLGHEIGQRARVARTFQNIRLFHGMTALENLMVAQHNKLMRASGMSVFGILGLARFRKAEAAAIEMARGWLERIGLVADADRPAGELPYGAQRRLEIARAMCTDPVLLCLDEPAAGLNPRESAELNELLLAIRAETGISILLIEHDMDFVFRVADRMTVLVEGAVLASGRPDAVRADRAVQKAYLGGHA